MSEILKVESTLTDRYQTTVPDVVRKALGLSKKDKICYLIDSDGSVKICRSEKSEEDPILGKFLDFLAKDIEQNPQQIQTIDRKTLTTIKSLVDNVEVDLDTPLSDEDE